MRKPNPLYKKYLTEKFAKSHHVLAELSSLAVLVNFTITFCSLQTKRLLGNVECNF